MWNILKSQWYQFRKSRAIKWILFFVVFFLVIKYQGLVTADIANGGLFAIEEGDMFCLTMMVLTLVIFGIVCAGDFTDKTINYEIMAGHKRKNIFAARMLLSLFIVSVLYIFMTFMCLVPVSVFLGWGQNADFYEVCLRYLLIYFIIIKLGMETALLAMIMRNAMATFFVGFMLLMGISVVTMLSKSDFATCFSSVYCVMDLGEYGSYQTIEINGEMINKIVTVIDWDKAARMLSVGAGVAIVCIVLSLIHFKKSDMR